MRDSGRGEGTLSTLFTLSRLLSIACPLHPVPGPRALSFPQNEPVSSSCTKHTYTHTHTHTHKWRPSPGSPGFCPHPSPWLVRPSAAPRHGEHEAPSCQGMKALEAGSQLPAQPWPCWGTLVENRATFSGRQNPASSREIKQQEKQLGSYRVLPVCQAHFTRSD